MSKRIEAFVARIAVAGDKSTAMKQLSKWMQKHLKLNGRPYNFKHHEMQEQIASDQHPHKCVKKCSQVGLTELSLRIAAAIAGVTRSRIIYVLPSAKFSEKVSTDRFSPIIKDSPILSAMQHPDSKAASMRKLGNTTVYFVGASGTTQAISIPATHLIIDEEDFCDPVVLGQFNSRLRHADEDLATGLRGVRQRFSTPTLPNYGISKHYKESDQKQYMVKCSRCNHSQAPNYYEDFVVPGYDGTMETFDRTDLIHPAYKVDEAYVKCKKCGNDLWADLINPERREWVAKHPDRIMLSGYAVSPIDVPHYNKVPAIIRQLGDYTTQDHRNFVVGIEHEDKNNSFLMSIFGTRTDSYEVPLDEAYRTSLSGVRIGIDIGKVAHIIIGKRVSERSPEVHIIYIGTIDKKNGTLASQIQKYIDAYDPEIVVLDAGPDFSTPQILAENNPYGVIYGCEYASKVKGAYTHLDPNAEEAFLKADRSGTLSGLMKDHNDGNYHYPRNCPELEVLKSHLKVTKKLIKPAEMGEKVTFPKPDKNTPDHYAHAMNYLRMADTLASDYTSNQKVVGSTPMVSTLKVGEGNGLDSEDDPLAEFLARKYIKYRNS